MEEIKLEHELRFLEVKRENLSKALEKVNSHASDILIFNLQWKDCEDYLKLAERKVEKRFRELESREKEFDDRSFALEERAQAVASAEADLELRSKEQRKELDFLRSESTAEELRLTQIRKSLEECTVEERSRKAQLTVMEGELASKGQLLTQMGIDLERRRAEVSSEKQRLAMTQACRRALEEETERKTNHLGLLLDQIGGCEKVLETRSSELRRKGQQLEQLNIDIEMRRTEVASEEEHFGRIQGQRKELEEETKRKRKDVAAALDRIAVCGRQLQLLEDQLDSQQKLLDSRSSQLLHKEKMLKDIQELIQERSSLDESIKSSIEEHTEELASKEKKQDEMTEAIRKLSLEIELVEERLDSQHKLLETRSLELISKEEKLKGLTLDLDLMDQMVKSLNCDMESTCQQIESKSKALEDIEKKIEERSAHYESINSLITEHGEELASKEKKQDEITEAIRKLCEEVISKKKTLERVNMSIEQLSGKQHAKEKKLDSTERKLEESSDRVNSREKKLILDLESKEKELQSLQMIISEKKTLCDQVQSSITNLVRELKSKECDLLCVKKKIQDSLKDFQSKEEQQALLKAALMEREQELGLKEKQLDARAEKNELKEKELDAREKNIDTRDQQLKSLEEKLAKCVKDYELKAKKLASFCQQNNADQHGNLVQDANVTDEKHLQLILHGHLSKCPQLHSDVSCALKASSDPAKLVLDTMQSLYSAHQRKSITSRDPNGVRRSSMHLLESLMDMSTKPKAEVQDEAIKFAIEWNSTTIIKAENPVEVLDFLHFVAAFSLAYDFDADKVQNAFDVAVLRKYVLSLCDALGASALATVNNIPSLDDEPEQQVHEVPINNSSDSRSPDVQETIHSPQLANEDALRDLEGSASFAANEISTGLPLLKDPGRFVLTSVEDALVGAHQRGELGLAEPVVKVLVPFLEELTRAVSFTVDPHLKSDATKVAHQWSEMMRSSGKISPLEAWGFLQFIVAFRLADLTEKDETLQFAAYVAHFKQAPKLFDSLGLRHVIPNFVRLLQQGGQYILATRFMLSFNPATRFSLMEYLKEEITNLIRSAKEERRSGLQAEDRDAGKLRDIIDLIDEFKLEIDLPVDLIVKFMVPRETQNQDQRVVSTFVPIQPQQILQLVHQMQASHTAIHSSYTAATSHGVNPSHPASSFGVSPNQQLASHHAGSKRPRGDTWGPRPVIRPCFNPSGNGRI